MIVNFVEWGTQKVIGTHHGAWAEHVPDCGDELDMHLEGIGPVRGTVTKRVWKRYNEISIHVCPPASFALPPMIVLSEIA